MKDNFEEIATGQPWRPRLRTAPEIAVFYPGNVLMHQVSNWSGKWPAYDFAMTFAKSLPEIRAVLRSAAISILDATDEPVLAMDVLNLATGESVAGCVTVYTEKMLEGLELFVRSRSALLLLGPMEDPEWEDLFQATRRETVRSSKQTAGSLRGQSTRSLHKRFRKTA